MGKLDRNLKSFMDHNKEGSYSTHANRSARLAQGLNQLKEKYKNFSHVKDLKTKHVNYLVERWKSEYLSPGTIKNRISDLRWISQKIDKQNIVKRTNDEYGIERRTYTDNEVNIAKKLTEEELERLSNEYVKYSLKLQEKFVLRREESIKFQPNLADMGDHIKLKGSWCKGGRERNVQITTNEQRRLVDEIKLFCRENNVTALIPADKNYKQQLAVYEKQCSRNEIFKNHGLRHNYAQEIYKKLTHWECPKNGGKLAVNMTSLEREKDRLARLQISSELGHNREDVTNVYLGGKR